MHICFSRWPACLCITVISANHTLSQGCFYSLFLLGMGSTWVLPMLLSKSWHLTLLACTDMTARCCLSLRGVRGINLPVCTSHICLSNLFDYCRALITFHNPGPCFSHFQHLWVGCIEFETFPSWATACSCMFWPIDPFGNQIQPAFVLFSPPICYLQGIWGGREK